MSKKPIKPDTQELAVKKLLAMLLECELMCKISPELTNDQISKLKKRLLKIVGPGQVAKD